MLYYAHEWFHAAVRPFRTAAAAHRNFLLSPLNPLSYTLGGKAVAAAHEVFDDLTKRYEKPAFGLDQTTIDGTMVNVREVTVEQNPFCDLIHFERDPRAVANRNDPRLLVVAPLSGHYATLLRGTIETLLPDFEVYLTDWKNAREVPSADGTFDLDTYVDYVTQFLRTLGAGAHVIGVCQPGVPIMMAVSLMAEDKDPATPASMVLMGSPIDTRVNPTQPNDYATGRSLSWFRRHVIQRVPPGYAGAGRLVYPGFLQLSGFLAMNLDQHVTAYNRQFDNLVAGDGDSAAKHTAFYEEYLSVMDLTAEYYLQTVQTVFQEHLLPRGEMVYRGRPVRPAAIASVALMTIEGEKDDISGLGQTKAAHDLCVNIPESKRTHYVQKNVGHYGVFNGRKWRDGIAPRIAEFVRANGG